MAEAEPSARTAWARIVAWEGSAATWGFSARATALFGVASGGTGPVAEGGSGDGFKAGSAAAREAAATGAAATMRSAVA